MKTRYIPTRKVALGALAGAAITIIGGILRRAFDLELTAEEGAAGALILTILIQYMIPDRVVAEDE